MLGFFVYLISIVDNIKSWFAVVGILILIYLCIMAILHVIGCLMVDCGDKLDKENGNNLCKGVRRQYKLIKIVLVMLAIAASVDMFLPSSKAIVAIYLVPKIVTNENVREIPGNTAKLFNKKLMEWIEDVGLEILPEKKVIEKE